MMQKAGLFRTSHCFINVMYTSGN